VQTIASQDGTLIACDVTGSGPPLVLVHGSGGSHARWAPVMAALSAKFTVYALDRRGRGESGDEDPYSAEREFEDVAAVIQAVGGKTYLLGHSFGGICALEALLLTDNVDKVVLYEPPVVWPPMPSDVLRRLQTLQEAGEEEALLTTFLTEIAEIPENDVEHMKQSPAWPARVAAAHTMLREAIAVDNYSLDPARFAEVRIPALLLHGGDTPRYYKESVEAVAQALPGSQTVVLDGQQHIAMDSAPGLFVREVLAFLCD
jgi:pimeloyl-ACP methyl ester carboxylesterase